MWPFAWLVPTLFYSNSEPGFLSLFPMLPKAMLTFLCLVGSSLLSPCLHPPTLRDLLAPWVLPPFCTALRALWRRRGGPGAWGLLVLVPIESQELPLLLDVFLCLQLLQGDLGWAHFH